MPEERDRLTVGAFQFAGSGSVTRNLAALERGIEAAAARRVRLLATQECALCGYPPVELDSPKSVDRRAQAFAVERVAQLAKRHGMFIALGMMTFGRDGVRNSVRLVSPEGRLRTPYHKRALYGWDEDNFTSGRDPGRVHRVDGIRVGLRICYEVRFPEYFRELFRSRVDLTVVSFADGGTSKGKYDLIRSHMVTRAAENAMYILSANSTSLPQMAPTCLVDPDGDVLCSAPRNQEALITGIVALRQPPFGRRGRILHSSALASHED